MNKYHIAIVTQSPRSVAVQTEDFVFGFSSDAGGDPPAEVIVRKEKAHAILLANILTDTALVFPGTHQMCLCLNRSGRCPRC